MKNMSRKHRLVIASVVFHMTIIICILLLANIAKLVEIATPYTLEFRFAPHDKIGTLPGGFFIFWMCMPVIMICVVVFYFSARFVFQFWMLRLGYWKQPRWLLRELYESSNG